MGRKKKHLEPCPQIDSAPVLAAIDKELSAAGTCETCKYAQGPQIKGTLACKSVPPTFVGMGYSAATLMPSLSGWAHPRVLPTNVCASYEESNG